MSSAANFNVMQFANQCPTIKILIILYNDFSANLEKANPDRVSGIVDSLKMIKQFIETVHNNIPKYTGIRKIFFFI